MSVPRPEPEPERERGWLGHLLRYLLAAAAVVAIILLAKVVYDVYRLVVQG